MIRIALALALLTTPAIAGQPNPNNDRLAARVAQYLVYDERCIDMLPLPAWLKQQVETIAAAIPDDVEPAVQFMRGRFGRGEIGACRAVQAMVSHQIDLGPKFPELGLTDKNGRLIRTVPKDAE